MDPAQRCAYDARTMKPKVLNEVLVAHAEGVLEDHTVRIKRESNTSLIVSMGYGTLTIERVISVECMPDVLVATTHRGERYILAYEDVRVVRVGVGGKRTGY